MFMKNELYKFQFFVELVESDKKKNKYRGGRNSTISTTYYLDKILFVLYSGITWSVLEKLNIICHYTAIYKKYTLWIKKGFFDKFQNNLLNVYINSIKDVSKCTFIDSTDVRNVNGSKKLTGYGRKFKGKRAIKVHSICDKNKITRSIIITPSNKMDVTQIEQLIEKVFIPIKKSYRNPHYTVGDKGYISKNISNKLRKTNIILTYPQRKNQKNNNSKYKKELLKDRFKVEHSYNNFKRGWKRIDKFYERCIEHYLGFRIIANSIMIINFLLSNL